MHSLHLVYSTINDYPSPLSLIFIGLGFILSVYGFFAFKRLEGDEVVFLSQTYVKSNALPVALSVAIFLGVLFLIVAGSMVRDFTRDKDIYNSNKLLSVEGKVSEYSPIADGGHGFESFKVNGVEFYYADYEAGRGGYHKSASHGGVIRPNFYVRVGYYNDGDRNIILKLETE